MRKTFLQVIRKIKQKISAKKTFFPVWLVFHLAVLLSFLATVLIFPHKIKIESDLFNLIPKSFSIESFQKADEKMTSITGQNIFILVANQNFKTAKDVAVKIYENLVQSDNFESISLYNDVQNLSEITNFLYDFRFNLLDEKTAQLLETKEGAEDFSLNALSQAYSGFTLLPLDNLETDPFLLTEYDLQNYLMSLQNSGTAMSVKDGLLASEKKRNLVRNDTRSFE